MTLLPPFGHRRDDDGAAEDEALPDSREQRISEWCAGALSSTLVVHPVPPVRLFLHFCQDEERGHGGVDAVVHGAEKGEPSTDHEQPQPPIGGGDSVVLRREDDHRADGGDAVDASEKDSYQWVQGFDEFDQLSEHPHVVSGCSTGEIVSL